MSLQKRRITESFRALAASGTNLVKGGIVTAVDEAAFTCSVKLVNGLELKGIRLKALKEAEKGVVLVPKLNSYVQALLLGGDEYLVIAAEEVEKIFVDAEAEIIINGGSNKGMVKLPELVQRLNNIENAFNDMVTHYNSHNHAHPQGPTTAFAPNITSFSNTLQQTSESDLENPKVKH